MSLSRRHQRTPPRSSLVPALAFAAVALAPWPGAPPLQAQTIRSYESLDRAAGEGAYTTLSLEVDGSTGNTEYVDLDFAGALGIRGETHWLRFYPGYRVRRSGSETVAHERSAHLRHSYIISPVTRTFAFVQFQSDESLELDRRFLLGGGIRRQLLALDQGGLDLGVGVMWEEEELQSGIHQEGLRGTNLLSVHGTTGAVALTLTGFFQPLLSDWGDHRVSAAGTAAVPLGERWDLAVSLRWRRDSRPPTAVEKDDAGISVGVRFSVD